MDRGNVLIVGKLCLARLVTGELGDSQFTPADAWLSDVFGFGLEV